jgi:hypothetical protein
VDFTAADFAGVAFAAMGFTEIGFTIVTSTTDFSSITTLETRSFTTRIPTTGIILTATIPTATTEAIILTDTGTVAMAAAGFDTLIFTPVAFMAAALTAMAPVVIDDSYNEPIYQFSGEYTKAEYRC